MILEELRKYERSFAALEEFIQEDLPIPMEWVGSSVLMYFLDTQKIFVGITSDENGEDWFVELNGMNIDIVGDRQSAEDLGIEEGFICLERILDKNEEKV